MKIIILIILTFICIGATSVNKSILVDKLNSYQYKIEETETYIDSIVKSFKKLKRNYISEREFLTNENIDKNKNKIIAYTKAINKIDENIPRIIKLRNILRNFRENDEYFSTSRMFIGDYITK